MTASSQGPRLRNPFGSGGRRDVSVRLLLLVVLLPPLSACGDAGPTHREGPRGPDVGGSTPRIVSLDYGLTETLLGLGVAPVGVPDIGGYETWVVEPELPEGVVDVGSTFAPNLELIQQLQPDLILTTPFLAGIQDQLERIAPTLSLAIYTEEGEPYRRAKRVARRLGERLGREAAAEALIGRVDSTLAGARRALRGEAETPLYFVRFLDPRHVRVFGEHSLYDDVLERLSVPNAWNAETNYWGFATVGIERLATRREARLFYLDPLPPDVLPTLARSGLWSNLPFVEAGHVDPFPMVLMFGGLPAAERFARLLVPRLSAHDRAAD